jgi:hypothetical protein
MSTEGFGFEKAGRCICVATAPVFAWLSKRMTGKVGEYADDLFRQDIEIEKIED